LGLVKQFRHKRLSSVQVHLKDVRTQEGLSVADILWTRGGGGSSDVDVELFVARTSRSLKIMVCPHGQRRRKGLRQCEQRRKGQFCADAFLNSL